MTCGYCGSRNGDGEHRCGRCGRKPGDTLTSDFAPHRTTGALANQPELMTRIQVAEPPESRAAPNLSRAIQGTLFPDRSSKVVAFEDYAPPRLRAKAAAVAPRTSKPPARRAPKVAEGQGSLDFLPPAPPKPRTLGTTVDAVIFCEAPVATTVHRAVAAALDAAVVLIGFGLFLLAFGLLGGPIEAGRTTLMVFGGMLLLIAFTYGLVFAISGTETAGMRWTHLKLISFDGFPPDAKQRVLRFGGSCLSLCTLVGLLWSLADEESLTWQDHISRTFPTPREIESLVFRRR
jgi:uncharacterized RDD family membrane protein YckC